MVLICKTFDNYKLSYAYQLKVYIKNLYNYSNYKRINFSYLFLRVIVYIFYIDVLLLNLLMAY